MSYFLGAVLALAAGAVSLLNGQFNAEFGGSSQSRIRGRVSGPDYGPLMVELYSADRRMFMERSLVAPNGGFDFNCTVTGAIELRVVNASGEVVKTEYLSAVQLGMPVTVELPSAPRQRPGSGVSTPYSLQHKVPRKAQAEYRKAEEASRKKDAKRALVHLRKALAIDPGFVEAHNNLAVRLVETGAIQDAVPVLQHASELDPNNPTVKANLRRVLDAVRRRQMPAVKQ